MRTAGQRAMGYYPTPDDAVPLIRSYVRFPEGPYAVLDPCAGTGKALVDFVAGSEARTYGIELDEHRAAEAEKVLHVVAQSDMMAAHISHGAFGALWYNPPYDWAAASSDVLGSERKEAMYLRKLMNYLREGGLLIALVPQKYVKDMARTLTTNFSNLLCLRFPDALYASYKQVVIFGVKRKGATRDPAMEKQLATISALDAGDVTVLDTQTEPLYAIPSTPAVVPKFFGGWLKPKESRYITYGSTPLWGKVGALLGPPKSALDGRPPLPLHTGHKAHLLACGALNGTMGKGGDAHLVKGTVREVVEVTEETESDGRGNEVLVTHERKSYQISIRAVDKLGQHYVLT